MALKLDDVDIWVSPVGIRVCMERMGIGSSARAEALFVSTRRLDAWWGWAGDMTAPLFDECRGHGE